VRTIWEVFSGWGFASLGLWLLGLGLEWWIPALPLPSLLMCAVVAAGLIAAIAGTVHAVRGGVPKL